MPEDDRNQKYSLLFLELVASFQMSALQSLGKLINPISGKVEADLNAAATSIDMLDMLAAKSRGNLSPEESRYLDEIINHLKLNFVEEMSKSSQKGASAGAEGEQPAPKPTAEGPSEPSEEKKES